MKAAFPTITAMSCAFLFLAAPAFAERKSDAKMAPQQYAYFGIHGSQHHFDLNSHGPKPSFAYAFTPGLQLGYQINKNWSLQGWWEEADISIKGSPLEDRFRAYLFSARHLYVGKEQLGFTPYTGAGLGDKKINQENETVGAFEFGVQRYLGHNWLVELGARPSYSFDNELWDSQLYVALNFVAWQPAKPSSKPAKQL
jgi:OOP family OmpA-OmpF porin